MGILRYVSAAHIRSSYNQEYAQSRINPELFYKVIKFGKSDVDLFGLRIKRESVKYVSWRPGPEATAMPALPSYKNQSIDLLCK